MDSRALLGSYFRQQGELSMPDAVVDSDILNVLYKPSLPPRPSPPFHTAVAPKQVSHQHDSAPVQKLQPVQKERESIDFKSRLSTLRPIDQLMATAPRPAVTRGGAVSGTVPAAAPVVPSGKRAALKGLYLAGCNACSLAAGRVKLAFGAGNADAPVMVIGDAPGAEENELGVPVAGEAGGLLTNMLAAINLDRNADVFLTNVLKCPLPGGRGPDPAETAACLPMLHKQIDIIRPKALLLLGTTAVTAVLNRRDDISVLRSKTLDYHGIPAMVTEHPLALLRSAALKRAAWEDLQQFRKLLSSLGIYGSLDKK